MMDIRVQSAAFDPGAELTTFGTRAAGTAGAVVSFTGLVRPDDGLTALEIEHYPGMTETALTDFAARARTRFGLTGVLILHRYGPMNPGEPIMMVATAAPHRSDAFRAAEFLMDWLKSRAPFWKRETREGATTWVAQKLSDEQALDRW